MRIISLRSLTASLALLWLANAAGAQQPIGSVGVQDATVAGNLEVTNGRAVLVGNTTVTAKDHTAEVALDRGGMVKVCATSGLHMSSGKTAAGAQTLMLALDRGAIEVLTNAFSTDFILTPDLRFAIQSTGPLDLRIRVTRNGDTCVENRGNNAPVLHIGDQFGEASYDLRAGQHVLFEHGSLKEVVDHESSPCGCPPAPVVSVADTGITSASPAAPKTAVLAPKPEEEHPFPVAVSQGLAPQAAVPSAPSDAVRTQVATTLSYNASGVPEPPTAKVVATTNKPATTSASAPTVLGAPPANAAPVSSVAPATVKAEAPLPPAAPSASDLAHRIGRFFKRLFSKG